MNPPAPEPTVSPVASELERLFGFQLEDESWMASLRRCDTRPASGRLGPYELLAEIGRGGQGIVYKARQPGTGREVALKRPAAGVFASPQMRARFEREIDAAAALDHPNIVTLFGTELIDGQAVLAMQWIDGVPFDRWAHPLEGPRRDVRIVLGAFVYVCDAIHHAHQRGVIHRDIKPSNILVDDAGRPHVLDFGLAKLTAEAASWATMTQTGEFIGTPAYAAPEQARSDSRAIDVRTDVYALGVVLYQALTGRLPFDGGGSMHRLLEQIRQVEPPPPSRQIPALGRELDAIVLKAMAKQKEARYTSVAALADDVGRYLAGKAVLAHPPSRVYRARKFTGQHRAGVAVVSAFLALLLAASGISTTFYLRAAQQRDRAAASFAAERQEHDRAEAALHTELEERRHAQHESDKSAAVSQFMTDMLKSADPGQRQGRTEITIRQAVDEAARRLASGEAKYDPEVEADVRMAIGEVYYNLTLFGDAMTHLRAAAELRRQALGPDDPSLAATLLLLSRTYRSLGLLEKAEQIQRELLALRRRVLGERNLYVAQALNALARTLSHVQKYGEAEATYRESMALYADLEGPESLDVALNACALGVMLVGLERLAEADALITHALEITQRHYGRDDPEIVGILNTLAGLRWHQLRYAEAERTLRDSIAMNRRLYPDPHHTTAAFEHVLGGWLTTLGRPAGAEMLLHSSLAAVEQLSGEQSDPTISILSDLETALRAQRRFAEAEQYCRRALEVQEAARPNDIAKSDLQSHLGEDLWQQGCFGEASEVLRAAWEQVSAANDPTRMHAVAERLAECFTAWDSAEPGRGRGEAAGNWSRRAADMSPP